MLVAPPLRGGTTQDPALFFRLLGPPRVCCWFFPGWLPTLPPPWKGGSPCHIPHFRGEAAHRRPALSGAAQVFLQIDVPLRCFWCMLSLSSFIVLFHQSQLCYPHAEYAALLQSGAGSAPAGYWSNWRQLCQSCFLLSQRHIVGEQMHRISLNSSNLV